MEHQPTICPQRVWKLKKQLRNARKEIEAKDKAIDFWIKEANTYKKKLELADISAEIYRTTSDGCYRLLSAKDESFDKLLGLLEQLTEENFKLKKQQEKQQAAIL